jgi:dolichol-phosphate mannosyltransferase
VPVRNEAENIADLFDALTRNLHCDAEIILVYDAEDDPTLAQARREEHRLAAPLRMVKNGYGAGPGNALRAGFDAAGGDAIVVVMADLSDDLPLLDRMYASVRAGNDVVCGSRYMRGGRQNGGPLLKRTLSRVAGVSLYWVLGLPTHDATNAFKAYRTSSLRALRIEGNGGFEISMEVTVKAWLAGQRITELPATWTDRTAGSSKFKLARWLPRYLRWYAYAAAGRLKRIAKPPDLTGSRSAR